MARRNSTTADLRAHLAALVNGSGRQPRNMPSAETYEISHAVAECAVIALAGEDDGILPPDPLPAPPALLPILP